MHHLFIIIAAKINTFLTLLSHVTNKKDNTNI